MAGVALLELGEVIAQRNNIPSEEVDVYAGCRAKAFEAADLTAFAGGVAMWAATKRLNVFIRISLSAGAAACTGVWRQSRSFYACADHILGLNGTQLQKELANIIVRRDQGEPWRYTLMSKHFYSEMVYEDSSDKPRVRWYSQNIGRDPIGLMTRDTDSDSRFQNNSQNSSKITTRNVSDVKKTNYENKQVSIHAGAGIMAEADTFCGLFGHTTVGEDIDHTKALGINGKVLNHKKSRRKRRMHRQEASLETQHT